MDRNTEDQITEDNLQEMAEFVREFSRNRNCITAVTGQIDLVSDGKRCFALRNGRPEMAFVTGTGCQLSAVMASFLAVAEDDSQLIEAALAAVGIMGFSGETAWECMKPGEGNGTYRNRILDALYCMTGERLREGIRFEVL